MPTQIRTGSGSECASQSPGEPPMYFQIIDTECVLTLEALIEANTCECDDVHEWARHAKPGEEWREGAGVRCIGTEAIGM